MLPFTSYGAPGRALASTSVLSGRQPTATTCLARRGIIGRVKIQRIANATETLGMKILRRTLSGPSWLVAPRVSIQSVLRKEESLSEAAFSMFTRGHFDCVVWHEDSGEPAFAVEFDGVGHDDPRQAERDRLKNLFCMAAGLPLLRVSSADLITRDRVSVLEWLSQPLLEWLGDEDDLDDEDAGESTDCGFAPPVEVDDGFDPDEEGAAFESEYPFPANAAIRDRLLRSYSISIGSPLTEHGKRPRIVMDFSLGVSRLVLHIRWPGRRSYETAPASEYLVTECDFTIHDRKNVLHAGTGRGRFAWAHRLPERVELPWLVANDLLTVAQMRYRIERKLSPLNLGWWQAAGVSRELATYDALLQVERWCRHHTSLDKRILA